MTAAVEVNNIHIFKTNIKSQSDYNSIKFVLDLHKSIDEWSIDLEDVDCVLRIKSDSLSDGDVVLLLKQFGFFCRELE